MRRPGIVAVAYSGGRDSTALLHATVHAARDLGLQVVALHVHHGLMPEADAWQSHARATCRRWARRGLPVECVVGHVSASPPPGASLEAWAREQRYTVLARLAREQGANLVLLAHHCRDQAETVLLQALRGAGTPGLSAMPVVAEREGIRWGRPWLDLAGEAIEAYVSRHRLGFVDDPSNAWDRLARSRLRQAVWPALSRAFPQAESALADTARWAQDATANLAALATLDLERIQGEDGSLGLADLVGLDVARQRNVVRHWLQARTGAWPAAQVVRRVVDEAPRARSGSVWEDQGGDVRSRGGRLHWVAAGRPERPDVGPHREAVLVVTGPGTFACPAWHGSLKVVPVDIGGVPARRHEFRLGAREGGEQFQVAPNRPPRALKKQFQARGVWASDRCGPVIRENGGVVFVPGLGVDARAWAPKGAAQWGLFWEPAAEP